MPSNLHFLASNTSFLPMENRTATRHQIIRSLTTAVNSQDGSVALELWHNMAVEIRALIGEAGFTALFARAVFLTRCNLPELDMSKQVTTEQFSALKLYLQNQSPQQASHSNQLLLITFTDVLAKLIGEAITLSILRSAWRELMLIQAEKELKNE